MLVRGEMLLREENDLVVEEGLTDLCHGGGRQRLTQADTADLGPGRAGESSYCELDLRVHGRHVSVPPRDA